MEETQALEVLRAMGLEKAWAVYKTATTLWTGEMIQKLVNKMIATGDLEPGEITFLERLTGRIAWPKGYQAA